MTLAIGSANTVSQHIPETKSSTGATLRLNKIGHTNDKVKTNEKEDASRIPLTSPKKSSLSAGTRIFLSVYHRLFSISAEKTIMLAILAPAFDALAPSSPL